MLFEFKIAINCLCLLKKIQLINNFIAILSRSNRFTVAVFKHIKLPSVGL